MRIYDIENLPDNEYLFNPVHLTNMSNSHRYMWRIDVDRLYPTLISRDMFLNIIKDSVAPHYHDWDMAKESVEFIVCDEGTHDVLSLAQLSVRYTRA